MRAALALTLPFFALLAACEPGGPKGVDSDRLTTEIGGAIGDPATCVLIVEKGSGKLVYRYGTPLRCARPLPSCSGPQQINTERLAELAAAGDARTVSCDAGPEGADRVGWASGPVEKSEGSTYGNLAYAAVMVGPSVLPGREIKVRLEAAMKRGGM